METKLVILLRSVPHCFHFILDHFIHDICTHCKYLLIYKVNALLLECEISSSSPVAISITWKIVPHKKKYCGF